MSPVQTFSAHDITPELCAEISELSNLIWPLASGQKTNIAATLTDWRSEPTTHFIIRDNAEQVRAHALLFVREIITAIGPIRVGALGNVCVHPDFRGRGWGAAVARAAFDFLPPMKVAVSLFQTPVPQFYEKLGCREIRNDFFDGTRADGTKANPFADKWQMIYPADFDWPRGEIDLNGPEY